MPIRHHHHLRALGALATVGPLVRRCEERQRPRHHPETNRQRPLHSPEADDRARHGAFADSSGWDEVIDQLRRDGYTARAPRRTRCWDCSSTPRPSAVS
jgi:hypothetical protein